MDLSSGKTKLVRFGLFEADLGQRVLSKSGLRIKLQDQPFQVLAMLLERPGELVTREELKQRLWPGDTFVDFEHMRLPPATPVAKKDRPEFLAQRDNWLKLLDDNGQPVLASKPAPISPQSGATQR